MKITCDPDKRLRTWQERSLDFLQAGEIFAGVHFTHEDQRRAYPEVRFITVGCLAGRLVVLVWTPDGEAVRIISMRKANEREQKAFRDQLGRSG